MAGEVENMVDVTRGRRQSMVLRIGIERCVSAITDTDDILAVGASVLAVVERLRAAGVASEVWVTFTHHAGDGAYQLRVKVQDAGRPIDLDRLAFWCMHPATLRRLAFAVEEMETGDVRRRFNFHGTYGRAHGGLKSDFFDEYAPARGYEVEGWITDVLTRRTR